MSIAALLGAALLLGNCTIMAMGDVTGENAAGAEEGDLLTWLVLVSGNRSLTDLSLYPCGGRSNIPLLRQGHTITDSLASGQGGYHSFSPTGAGRYLATVTFTPGNDLDLYSGDENADLYTGVSVETLPLAANNRGSAPDSILLPEMGPGQERCLYVHRYSCGSSSCSYSLSISSDPVTEVPFGNVYDLKAIPAHEQVTLSWKNPGGDFAGVRIVRKTGSFPAGYGDGTTVYDGTGTGFTDTSVTNGTTYYYKAFAYDSNPIYTGGVGVVATPQADVTPPANVSGFSVTAGDTLVNLSWTNPGDSDFSGVRIVRKTGSYPAGIADGTVVYNGTGTSYVDTGRTNGVTYYYAAFSYDLVPNYASGAQGSATPTDAGPPGPVTSFMATGTDERVELSWVNPGDADLVGVKILRKIGNYPTGPNDGTTVHEGPGTSATDTGLTNGVQYYYAAFAYDDLAQFGIGVEALGVPGQPPGIVFGTLFYSLPVDAAIVAIVPTPNGSPITNCSVSPALPIGLVFNTVTCAISGVPTQSAPRATYEIQASNDYGSVTESLEIEVLNRVPTPTFSPDGTSGIETEAIEIIGPAGATVYFTIDGTEPDLTAPTYAEPIDLWKLRGKRLRAIAVQGGLADSLIGISGWFRLQPLATGQTDIVMAGDDGFYQKGTTRILVGPTPHDVYSDDITTFDPLTGLTWRKCIQGREGVDCIGITYKYTLADATSQCSALNERNGGDGYAGRRNWRLPTLTELKTLMDFGATSNARMDTVAFPSPAGIFWSSTLSVKAPSHAYGINFGGPQVVIQDASLPWFVRCVSD